MHYTDILTEWVDVDPKEYQAAKKAKHADSRDELAYITSPAMEARALQCLAE